MILSRWFPVLSMASLLLAPLAMAQTPPATPAPPLQAAGPNMQFANEVMRTASAVHDLLKGMDLEKTFGPQNAYPPGDPRALQRTAEFIGVGAGIGVELGEMAHTQKGVLIGAAAGSAGGLIVDQVIRHQAAKRVTPAGSLNPSPR